MVQGRGYFTFWIECYHYIAVSTKRGGSRRSKIVTHRLNKYLMFLLLRIKAGNLAVFRTIKVLFLWSISKDSTFLTIKVSKSSKLHSINLLQEIPVILIKTTVTLFRSKTMKNRFVSQRRATVERLRLFFTYLLLSVWLFLIPTFSKEQLQGTKLVFLKD